MGHEEKQQRHRIEQTPALLLPKKLIQPNAWYDA
jgi:hypothetical protein